MDQEKFEQRKQTIYSLICDDQYIPMKIKEIAILLNIPRENRTELEEVLDALVADGKIEISKKGKYSKAQGRFVTGKFIGNPRGFGFVEPAEGTDIFISEENTCGAMHGDEVQVLLMGGAAGSEREASKSGRSAGGMQVKSRRREGVITRILSRATTRLVGTYEKTKSFGFVKPDNQRLSEDIFIPQECSGGAVTGHKVVVEITDYGRKDRNPEGRVVEIIGHINDPGTDIMSIIRGYDLPMEFPEKVLNQAETVSKPVSDADRAGRLDLRNWQTVTIDGEDAKDLDDAVTLTMEGENYRLGVHIADVTNYVQEGSALDAEALNRGTSVYLVDRVIPMLPHTLSNGICSLNEGEDRLALSCIMLIDGKGNVIDHQIAETVIRVDRRMSYTSVKKILADHDETEMNTYRELVPMFLRMEQLAAILREKRRLRGSIDFDFPETKMILDAQGKPITIAPYDRNVATRIIEDFMLIANETVAQDYFWQELPFVYRSHENPDPEKIRKLAAFINNFGYAIRIGQDEVHPKELQKLLARIEDSPEEALISRLTLRSMKRAKYTTESIGHFGLATRYYCHFTSPIRRYPDLQIHRIIKENLRGRLNEGRIAHYEEILPQVAARSSELERRADEAERETEKLKKVEYMEDHIGEEYEGVISSITAWGIYVELPNTIEGMVHVSNLEGDYFRYQEDTYEMVGETTNICYKLGQKVKVRVAGADRLLRIIDFLLIKENEHGQGKCEADRQQQEGVS